MASSMLLILEKVGSWERLMHLGFEFSAEKCLARFFWSTRLACARAKKIVP